MIHVGANDRVFVLTGAGVSAESGIPTFRDAGGLWHGYRVEEVASPQAWAADPALVWQFYSMRRRTAAAARPNPAHLALSDLQRRLEGRLTLCTQNVDDLHERAGSTGVIHMHGRLFQSRCDTCKRSPFDDPNLYEKQLPRCECGGLIRPHICWFGEMPFELERIYRALAECTLFVAVGTSGLVHPAAGFAAQAHMRGKTTYYVGPEEPANSPYFTDQFQGAAGQLVPWLFQLDAPESAAGQLA